MVCLEIFMLSQMFLFVQTIKSMNSYYENNIYLQSERQISTFLKKGEEKVLKYWSDIPESYLSITVTSCGSNLKWFVQYRSTNDTLSSQEAGKILYETNETKFSTWRASHMPRGLYQVHVIAVEKSSGMHVYTSTEPDGPQALLSKVPRIRFQKHQRNGRLTVKWNQSAVDPHVTHYCLVVSSNRTYTSLCEAQVQHYGNVMTLPNNRVGNGKRPKNIDRIGKIAKSKNVKNEDILIKCVGSRLQYTVSDLVNGQTYNFALFAVNQQTNFSFPYGTSILKFNRKIKPISLKDGKSAFANLKKVDGKAVFRYKVSEKLARELLFYIMPCGGGVEVDVSLKGVRIVQKRRVDGYEKLLIRAPMFGQRYYIRVISSNKEELRRTSGVEVLATTRSSNRFPLPTLPENSEIYRYSVDCDNALIGWIPSPDSKIYQYCVMAREGSLHEIDGSKMSNQCGLETRMRKSADFTVKYCQESKKEKQSVMIQRVSELRPNRPYVIQVMVKKNGGKALSYDLLQIHTKTTCKQNNTY